MRAKVREIEEWRLGESPSSKEIADELYWDDVNSLSLISTRDLYERDEWDWWDNYQDQLSPEEEEWDDEPYEDVREEDYDNAIWC